MVIGYRVLLRLDYSAKILSRCITPFGSAARPSGRGYFIDNLHAWWAQVRKPHLRDCCNRPLCRKLDREIHMDREAGSSKFTRKLKPPPAARIQRHEPYAEIIRWQLERPQVQCANVRATEFAHEIAIRLDHILPGAWL
jgi:hypothetical protein